MLSRPCRGLANGAVICQAGLQRASHLAAKQDAEQARQQAGNEQGSWPALSYAAVPEDEAVQLLLSAEAMLQACPDSHAAQCARAEVCTRLCMPRAPSSLAANIVV